MAKRVISTMVCRPNGIFLSISDNGDVYSTIKDTQGSVVYLIPEIIPSLTSIREICCGFGHCICLDNDGNVFTYGVNLYGQLGVGKSKRELQYTRIPQKIELPPIRQISCGHSFNMCLSEEGKLFSFGNNSFGQLGLGSTKSYTSPQQILSVENIDFVECGRTFAICYTFDSDVYCWGENGPGQLGIECEEIYFPKNCTDSWPENIVDIKCGIYHTLVLTSNQEVYSCGSGTDGKLGRVLTGKNSSSSLEKIQGLSEIVRIECGDSYSMCIDIYNELYVFGNNAVGQLGLCDTLTRYSPVKNTYISNIIDISSKGDRSFVKTSLNEIYTFGDNSSLGEESRDNIFTPVRVFQGQENIWRSSVNFSKAKSARSII